MAGLIGTLECTANGSIAPSWNDQAQRSRVTPAEDRDNSVIARKRRYMSIRAE
jgi:hypothetical protein